MNIGAIETNLFLISASFKIFFTTYSTDTHSKTPTKYFETLGISDSVDVHSECPSSTKIFVVPSTCLMWVTVGSHPSHVGYCGISPVSCGLLWDLTHLMWVTVGSHPSHVGYCGISPISCGLLWDLTRIMWVTVGSHPSHMGYCGISPVSCGLLWDLTRLMWVTVGSHPSHVFDVRSDLLLTCLIWVIWDLTCLIWVIWDLTCLIWVIWDLTCLIWVIWDLTCLIWGVSLLPPGAFLFYMRWHRGNILVFFVSEYLRYFFTTYTFLCTANLLAVI